MLFLILQLRNLNQFCPYCILISIILVVIFLFCICALNSIDNGSVVKYPNLVLRKKAKEVSLKEAKDLIQKMIKIVVEEDGAGLAAPQIGESKRIALVQTENGFMPLINPKITPLSLKKITINEGCLSLPGIWVDVPRYKKIKVETLTTSGEKITLEAEDILSVIIQHETDHLDGVLIIDKIPFPKKISVFINYLIKERFFK